MSILALDLGTNTGWAAIDAYKQIQSGVQIFKPGRFEGGGMRYLRFKAWLTEIKMQVSPLEAIYFEEVRRHMSVDAAHAYGGFMAHLTAWCEHHKIPYQGVPVGTIKKYACGAGNANKDAMVAAVNKWGFDTKNDNEADAICLLKYSLKTYWPDLAKVAVKA